MKHTFAAALRAHQARYPLMQPGDYGKLARQSALGPAHFAPDTAQCLTALLGEWEAAARQAAPCAPESIGNGLCRFHLTNEYDPRQAAPLLTELFCLTAEDHQGTAAGLAEDLELLETLDIPGMADWLAEYRRQGCPPVHHTRVFRQAYCPHYRLLKTEYAGYFPALMEISRLTERAAPVIVAIDGQCGSGKTGLAALMGQVFDCNVFHMDDFYLPLDARDPNWTHIPGGNMDFARFLQDVLAPAARGEAVRYRPFDCRAGQLGQPVTAPPRPLTVVEGSYAHHPSLAARYDYKIFLTCDPKEQAERLKRREGAGFQAFQARWIPMEEQYFASCGIERRSTMTLDTSCFF